MDPWIRHLFRRQPVPTGQVRKPSKLSKLLLETLEDRLAPAAMAVDDGPYPANENSILNVPDGPTDVLANDFSTIASSLTISGFDSSSASGAAVNVNADGSFSYDPTGVASLQALDEGASFTDTFTYTILEDAALVPASGLVAGSLTGDLNSIDPNPGNLGTSPGPQGMLRDNGPRDAEREAHWTAARGDSGTGPGSTTLVYSGEIFLQNGDTHFIEQNDDKTLLVIEGTTVLNNSTWNAEAAGTFNNAGAAGWFSFELRVSNGGGGYGFFEQGGWNGIDAGFLMKIGGAFTTDETQYFYPEDPGDASLFRHFVPAQVPATGLLAGSVTGNLNAGAANPENLGVVLGPQGMLRDEGPRDAEREAHWTAPRGDSGTGPDNTTLIYSGQIFLQSGDTHFIEQNDDVALLVIDGDTILNNGSWNSETAGTFNNPGAAGWFDFDLRVSNGGGGYGYFGQTNNGGWGAGISAGFLMKVGGPFTLDESQYIYPEDPGDGSLFRHFVPAPGTTDTATVSVQVNGVNDQPNAVDDNGSITEALNGVPTPNTTNGNVLTNDTDIDDANSSFSVTQVNGNGGNVGISVPGSFGSLQLNINGTYTYTLDDANPLVNGLANGATLTDTFTYTMSDNHSGGNAMTDGATLTITIVGVNDATLAEDNSAAVTEDGPLTDSGNLITDDDGLDTNHPDGITVDVDPDARNLNVHSVANGSTETDPNNDVTGTYGTLDWDTDGSYTYTLDNGAANVQALAQGQMVTDTFTYALHDGFVSGNGLMNVQVVNTSGTNPGNNTTNWLNVWTTLDGGAGPTGNVAGFNVVNNTADTETVFDYAGDGGTFSVNTAIGTIAGDGPGGGPGPFNPGGNSGVDYSIRARTFLAFNSGGTFTIAMASDDGRRIELTDATPGGSTTFNGFASRGGQVNGGFTAGDTVIGFSGPTGHDWTVGTFSVAAGDILFLDAFYYEGGGGDSGEIAIAQGSFGDFTNTSDFRLLQEGVHNIALSPSATFSPLIHVGGDGLMDVQVVNTSVTNPGNDTANWLNVWTALAGGGGPTGNVAGFNVVNNTADTETVFDYAGDGGNFGVNTAIGTINGDGPGGGPGPFNPGGASGNDYSIRGRTYLAFNKGGTFTIAMGSDDGRRIELTDATPGGSLFFNGFATRGGQTSGGFTAGDTVIGFSGGTGHNWTVGSFTVAAGDILFLDAFYYEGGGGDSGEIAIAQGSFGGFTNTTDFQLLQDGVFDIALNRTSTFTPIFETATLTVTITGVNDPPVANDDPTSPPGLYQTTEDNILSLNAVDGVLANDTDPDSVITVLSADAVSANGAVVNVNPDGSFTYDPTGSATIQALDEGQVLDDTFTYTITDAAPPDGLINVSAFAADPGGGSTDNDLNSTLETLGIWDAIDGGATVPGPVVVGPTTYNIARFEADTETRVIYNGNLDGFTGSLPYASINSDGPGGGGGSITGGDDFSVRAQAFLRFNAGGTYSISAGSDDGRRIELTEASPGSAPGYTGFTAAGNQTTSFSPGNVVFFNGTTGHNHTTGVFTVAAGDILELDTFFFERGGGDQFHVSIKAGNDNSHGGAGEGWELLQDGAVGVSVASTEAQLANAFFDSATVTIRVNGINDAPNAVNDGASLTEAINGVPASNTVGGNVLSNDTDADDPNPAFTVTEVNGNNLNVGSVVVGSFGTVQIDGNGSYTYTLDDANPAVNGLEDGESLTDTFTYRMSDNHPFGNVKTDTATLTITINGANDAPVANDDPTVIPGLYQVSEDGTLTINVADGLLANDIDPDNPIGVASTDDTSVIGILNVDLTSGTLGGLTGEYIDINDGTFLVGNRTGNNDRLFDPLDEFVATGVSDFVLQRHPIAPSAVVITPRVDLGTGTDGTQGDGTVLDRGGFSSGSVPPWQGLFNDVGETADMDGDQIGAAWSGKIQITTAGTYTFTTRSDDGSVLFINGQRIVNNNNFQGMTNRNGSIFLDPGMHDISIGGYEGGGGAGFQASYSGPDTGNTRIIIPPTVLFNDVVTPGTFVSGGLRGEYFDFNNPGSNGGFNFNADEWVLFPTDPGDTVVMESLSVAVTQVTERIDFGAGTESSPGDGTVLDRAGSGGNIYGGIGVNIGNDQVAGVWTGFILIPETADFQFTGRSDDHGRVYVDINNDGDFNDPGELVASRNGGGMSNYTNGSVSLTAGPHAFKAITGEGTGDAGFQVSWEQLTGSTFAREIIPPTAFTTIPVGDGSFTYDPNGLFNGLGVGETDTETFTYTVQDTPGETDTATVTITIIGQNDAPIPDANGPYNIDAGQDLMLDASATTDADTNDILTYNWDFDQDGTPEFTTLNPIDTADWQTHLQNLTGGGGLGQGTHTIDLIVNDGTVDVTTSATLIISSDYIFDAAPPVLDYTLRLNGTTLEIVETANTGNVLSSVPAAGILTIQVNGSDLGADTLRVDFTGGTNPIPANGLSYDGGDPTSGPGDILTIENGAFTTVTHNMIDGSSGDFDLDGSTITYTGLEPVIMPSGTVADLIVNLTGGFSDTVLLEDNGATPGDGQSQVRTTSGTAETFTFVNPTSSLTINLGTGDDTLEIAANFDSGTGGGQFNADLIIDGQGDNDGVTNNTILTAVNLTVTSEQIVVNDDVTTSNSQTYDGPVQTASGVTLSNDTGTGITFNTTLNPIAANGDLTVTTTGSGVITFDGVVGTPGTAFGTLTIDNVGAADLNANLQSANQVVKTGAGTLTFANLNHTFSGSLDINQGTVDLLGTLSAGSGNDITLVGNATVLTSSGMSGQISDRGVNVTGDNAEVSDLQISHPGATAVDVSGASASIDDNTITNAATGIRISGSTASATLVNNNITPDTTGVQVENDGTVNLGADNVINGGSVGLLVTGPTSLGNGIGGLTLNNTTFDNQSTFHVELVNMAHAGPEFINGADAIFTNSFVTSTRGQDMTVQEIQDTDSLLMHFPDMSDLGLIFLQEDVAYKDNDTLLVIGTSGRDRLISVNSYRPGRTTVTGIRNVSGTFDMTARASRISVIALGGNDVIRLTGYVPGEVYGGAGNDYIYGGYGKDILHGQEGNDYIRGGLGSDMLIGGTGRDYLYGDAGNDVMIGGTPGSFVSYADLFAALMDWDNDAINMVFPSSSLNTVFSLMIDDGESDLLADTSGTDAFLRGAVGDRVFGANGFDLDQTH